MVSTAGIHHTFGKLLDPVTVPAQPRLQALAETLPRTHGHVFLFVGLEGDAKSLDLPRRNLWVLPHDDLDKGHPLNAPRLTLAQALNDPLAQQRALLL